MKINYPYFKIIKEQLNNKEVIINLKKKKIIYNSIKNFKKIN